MNSVALKGYPRAKNSRGGDAAAAFEGGDLPLQVRQLARREGEIATIVYRRGATTANEALSLLSSPISNAAVRSMLNRLVGKGILKRRPAGAGKAFVYVPAIAIASAIEQEFMRLADDYFGGSMERALDAIGLLQLRRREFEYRTGGNAVTAARPAGAATGSK
jgi:predicted transcriptional regulator